MKVIALLPAALKSVTKVEEVFAALTKEAKEYKGTLKILRASFLDTEGILLNLAVRGANKEISKEVIEEELRDLKREFYALLNSVLTPTFRARSIAKVAAVFFRIEDTLLAVSFLGELTPSTLKKLSLLGDEVGKILLEEFLQCNYSIAKGEEALFHVIETDTDISQASLLEVWSDTDGILTANPKKVAKVFTVKELTYAEAIELSHFGTKVVDPLFLRQSMRGEVPIFIKRVGSESGTVVLSSLEKGDGNRAFGRSCAITAIASIDKVALIRVEGSALIGSSTITARLFSRLSQRGINVILITQAPSEYNVCIAVSGNLAKEAKSYINEEFQWEIQCKALSEAILEEDFAIISIVGEAMRHTPGVAARFFSSLARNGVNIATIAQGSSELNVSVVIRGADEIKALSSVHDEFFGAATSRSINVAIAGVGLIGKTLLKQLRANMPRLATSLHLEVKLIGIATSKGYVFNQEGIPGDEWDIVSADSGFKNEGVEKFVDDVIAANLPATIFIDCTASNEVSDEYAKLLSHHINVVTPNKRAQSGPYQKLRKIRESNRASWLYETSVGAGLPIISTLRDLLNSGDSILTIEAILSGTLGFVCSTCMEGEPFSKVVYRAKELGFTEPDPRDDLNGMDVARKLLILARECGSSLELTDVFVESLVPKELVDIQDTSVFLSRLPQYDESFTKRVREVEMNKAKLMYVARYDALKNILEARLMAVSATHPFYNVSGSDNIISFTSQRYNSQPLVVRGPGAGAEVTAAGIFADIVRLSPNNF